MSSRTAKKPADTAQSEALASPDERFYDDRYEHGYMEAWPEDKKRRIAEVIRNLPLPQRGAALDFGCGNGTMTAVLRSALPPGWTVHGCDISSVAVRMASESLPDCKFFLLDDAERRAARFDLVFTHHVLEHVGDLGATVNQIAALQNPNGRMLHILPCGNAGSLEHELCSLRRDGVDPARGNRFFFEDEGHVRRLTTAELAESFAAHRFTLTRDLYSNQHDGAINWMTQTTPAVVRRLCDVGAAVDAQAAKRLKAFRRRLLPLWLARIGAAFVDSRLRRKTRSPLDYVLLAVGLVIYPFTKPFDIYIRRRADAEWLREQASPNGSEMYLFFERGGSSDAR
jgi:trans-aconitate methyltransferase